MITSENINELALALSKAQGQIKGAIKDSSNPFFKNKYADLSSVWDACREQLSQNGLSVVQTSEYLPELVNDYVLVETQLNHSSGQWIRGRLAMKPVKNDPQSIGSCITYARRYSLMALLGIAPEDDDGNAASGNTDEKNQSQYQAALEWKNRLSELPDTTTAKEIGAWWAQHKETIKTECGDANASGIYKIIKSKVP